MGQYTAIVGVLVAMLVVAAIGFADVIRDRRARSKDRPSAG